MTDERETAAGAAGTPPVGLSPVPQIAIAATTTPENIAANAKAALAPTIAVGTTVSATPQPTTPGAAQAAAWTQAEAQAADQAAAAPPVGISVAPSSAAQTVVTQADAAAQADATGHHGLAPGPLGMDLTAGGMGSDQVARAVADGVGNHTATAGVPVGPSVAAAVSATASADLATTAEAAMSGDQATSPNATDAAPAPAPAPGDQPPATGDRPGGDGTAGSGSNGQNPDQQGTFTSPASTIGTGLPGQDLSAGITGAAPVGPAAPAAPTSNVAPPPAPPLPGPIAMQLATRITPLRLDADGVHRLTVNLHPVDLGPVTVIAEIRNGEVNVQLTSSTDAGHESLRDAMDELRRDLEQSGFANTSLDLRQGSGQEQARQQFAFMNGGRAPSGGGNAPASAETAPPVPSRPTGNSRLDIEA